VLIYFDRESASEIVHRLYECLNMGGYLFVGHSDIIEHRGLTPCKPEGTFVYHKAAEKPGDPSPTEITASYPVPMSQPPAHVTEISPRDDAQELFSAALLAFEQEDYPRACDQLNRLLQEFPRHVQGTLLRANVYLNQGQHDGSVRECEVALQLDSFSAEAHMLMGMNFRKLSKPELAVTQLKKAAYVAPESCVVQFQLGEAYRAASMPDHARRAYENALALLPQASERDVQTYFGAFGKLALKTFCEQMTKERQRSNE
jgi:chemotaxis protein methyltransferase CheR